MNEKMCPKCNAKMDKGFIGDKKDMSNETRQTWGTGINALGSGLDNAHPVTTYRCTGCGYLESYAI